MKPLDVPPFGVVEQQSRVCSKIEASLQFENPEPVTTQLRALSSPH
jgi:hypothetical protein